jgi:hypothetical protein
VPARWISSSLLVAGVLLAAEVRADPPPAVDYVAPPECPPAETFTQQLAARTPVFREHAADHRVRIEVVTEAGGVLGRASLVLAGHPAERELRAARCEEVVEALALVVAILIDPNADTRPMPVASAAPPAPEPVAPAPVAPPARTAPPPSRPRRAAPPRSAGPRRRFIAGAHAAVEGAVAPELSLGPRLFAGVEFNRALPWPTSLRLSGARLFSRELADAEGTMSLVLDTARADACFLRLRERRLTLEPCAGVDLGVLRIDANHPRRGVDSTQFWADVGGMVRASVTTTDWLVGEAEIGVDVPLVQYRFAFQGRPALHRTARAGMHLGLGLGVRFP